MQITYVVVVTLITYILGAFTKAFIKEIPNRYIPIQNVVIGLISAGVCVYSKIETSILHAMVLCITASSGAGGLYDLINKTNYK